MSSTAGLKVFPNRKNIPKFPDIYQLLSGLSGVHPERYLFFGFTRYYNISGFDTIITRYLRYFRFGKNARKDISSNDMLRPGPVSILILLI